MVNAQTTLAPPGRSWRRGRLPRLSLLVALLVAAGWLGGQTGAVAVEPDSAVQLAQGQASLETTFDYLLQFPTAGGFNPDFEARIETDTLVNETTVSSRQMTLPSLWWNRDALTNRLGGTRLVQSWLAYRIAATNLNVVDVSINSQIWNVLSYGERYAVLNQFAAAANDYGHHLRLWQGNSYSPQLIGMYVCQFPTATEAQNQDLSFCKASVDADAIFRRQLELATSGSD